MSLTIQDNGLVLIHKQTKTNDIVGLVVYVRHGAASDPDGREGLTNLMMQVLTKGTKKRSADEIAEELGLLGAGFTAAAGHDCSILSMQCVREDLDEAMEIFADLLLNPTFPAQEVNLERERTLAQIRMLEDQPQYVASRRFRENLFGSHAYGKPLQGTAESLQNLQAPDLYDAHRKRFVPPNMVFSVVGNVEENRIHAIIKKYFGADFPDAKERYATNKIITPGGNRDILYKESQQSFIVMGHLLCPAGHKDEPALEVAASVLGSGMSSRLFRELRDKQGLAYAVGAQSHFFRQYGYLISFIGTNPASAEKAEKGMWDQIKLLRDEPVPENELQRAKNYIFGQYLRGHERNIQQARYLGFWYFNDRGVEYDEAYLKDIEAVTVRDVMRVANKYFLEPTVVLLYPKPTQGSSPPATQD